MPPIANAGSIDTTVALRVANALEYIAAQLGDINRKFDTFNAAQKNNADSALAAAAKRLADQI
jgi:hypothetical protein